MSRSAPVHTCGMTLIELTVAMAIGAFLTIGALTVFTQGQSAYRANESIARLQERARLALPPLETDLRMAGYFGLTTRSSDIANRASPARPTPPNLAVGNDCANNWSIHLDAAVAGTNNGFAWAGCAPYRQAQPGADTLVVRRASAGSTPPDDLSRGMLYVNTARFGAGYIFVGGAALPHFPASAVSRSYQLTVRGYYVSQHSSLDMPGNPVPSLRVKTLTGGSLGPRITDREVMPGVEDLQVQFGVDTDRAGQTGWGSVDRYVHPGDPMLDAADPAYLREARVLAVRVWVRVRAERPEQGYRNTTEYNYADRHRPATNDPFRRTVVTKTVLLRNARSAS